MSLQFIEKEQFWYVSAFLDSSKVDGMQISSEIENVIKAKLNDLTDKDIYRKEFREDIFEMVKNVSIKCNWVPYLENFPYRDENSDYLYNTLGYFEFEVNYFHNDLAKKESLSPMLIQQIPYIILNSLKNYDERPENKELLLDIESPIYVFATSHKTLPQEVQWTQENIEKQ